MPADALADVAQQKAHTLHALEKGAAVRRAILSCDKDGVRALLRERDALAMQILQTQREIDYVRTQSISYLDEIQASQRLDLDNYTARWLLSNEHNLVFMAVHQRILSLTYVEPLLESVRGLFVARYPALVRGLMDNSVSTSTLEAYAQSTEQWSSDFMQVLRRVETAKAPKRETRAAEQADATPEKPALSSSSPMPTLKYEKADVGPGGRRVVSGKGKKGKPSASAAAPAPAPSTDAKKPTSGKDRRKWGDNNEPLAEDSIAALDFSKENADASQVDLSQWIDQSKLGTKRADGVYELADDESEQNDSAPSFFSTLTGSSSSLFARITGKKDALTKEDLAPVLHAMQMHLQSKNVANDVASLICEGVEKRLLGKRIGNFGSVKAEVRKSLEESITRILTPSTSTDILLEIASKKKRRAELAETLPAHALRGQTSPALNPYSIGFVGVNGVGKSTNLAKVCFWLLQNRYRVLIAACDTFRSGAVEQLRTHVRNLGELEIDGRRVADGMPETGEAMLELYERGYGKDAAGIAKEALSYARTQGFDVVLIDTAGRMQDNEPLMRALAKLIAVNQPDKVLFVGEALVGNEAVDQLTKFHRALKDYSGVSHPRGLDGCLLTKWDTVDVPHVVNALLRD
ncbi:hypothetical protein MCAP1_001947 [Malassezia caprae]|uniref:Signal recognition particle receptor subunit alpha homolog n=1 Tax=Malassezia caprae TaxID=1381934 RepID=A0AAF0EAW0_9BASI|nr:hypothetical protein MCAP1_001947 [Malassezia caprae]